MVFLFSPFVDGNASELCVSGGSIELQYDRFRNGNGNVIRCQSVSDVERSDYSFVWFGAVTETEQPAQEITMNKKMSHRQNLN